MGRIRISAYIAVAWVAPLAWLAVVLSSSVSDGTAITSSTAFLGDQRWGDAVTVIDTYGDTPLRPGDRIEEINGRSIADSISERGPEPKRDEIVRYQTRRPGELDTVREIEVPLTRYPAWDAIKANLDHVVLATGLLAAGSLLLWRRAREPFGIATLGAGSALTAALTAGPFGVQAIDLTSSQGLALRAAGTGFLLVGLGAVLTAAFAFPRASGEVAIRAVRIWWPLVVPLLVYAGWVLGYAAWQPSAPRVQTLVGVPLIVVATTGGLGVLALAAGYARSRTPEDRVAVRLVVLGLLAAFFVRAVLHDLPTLLRDEPLVPGNVLALALIPTVLVCWVAAVLGDRLLAFDGTMRRALLQIVVATVVGAAFLAAVGAVNLTSRTSMGAMVAGGVVAIMLLPLALLVRRAGSRILYGDRANPYRIVSELRRLDPATAPEDALHRTLAQLTRSLRLTYAAVEVFGATDDESTTIALGEPRGERTTVMLEVAGSTLGRLDLEVDPLRDQLGPRDRRLLEDIGSQMGALVQAMTSTRELQRARERLVVTREEERRRLRRDLHDGLGPSLASLLMRLEVARDLVARDPKRASALLGQLTDQTEADIAEIRRLVEGLRPPVLDQLGLVSALQQKAAELGEASGLGDGGARFSWSVVADELGVLPAAAEVAAYRIALEAVSNAARHSGGSRCVVALRRRPDALEVEIRDDGSGFSDARRPGVGIGSMRERAEELGGSCTITSSPNDGTVVTAVLPLMTPAPPDDEWRS